DVFKKVAGDKESSFLVSTSYAEIMALDGASAGEGINVVETSSQPDTFQLIWLKDGFICLRIIRPFGIFPTRPTGFSLIVRESLPVEIFYLSQACIKPVIGVPRNPRSSRLSSFGSNQNHTVGTPRTVDSRSGSVF